MKEIEFISVNKSYGEITILKDVNFSINKGEFVTILGANGSGKSSLLNLISARHKIDSGKIDLIGSPNISYLKQNYKDTIFPWKNNLTNLTLPLTLKKIGKIQRNKKAKELIKVFNLDFNESKYPYELSGGQQQQLAILRSFISNPDILLLDEPFGALDYAIRRDISNQVLNYWKIKKNTVIMVTHDIDEAIMLSDKILILKNKSIDEIININLIFQRPRNINLIATQNFGKVKVKILELLEYVK
ncbi:MAG: ABC-type nitrate/sulfonate/bicarbonate transport system ATPase subunit [Dokdonia sp.]